MHDHMDVDFADSQINLPVNLVSRYAAATTHIGHRQKG